MIANLQTLRAIAALAVLFYHLQPMLNRRFDTAFTSHIGAVGVDIFFVLSGIVMVLTCAQKKRSAGQFYGERIIRIAPLYWAASFSLIALFKVGFRPNGLQAYDTGDVFASIFFFPKVRSDGENGPILSLGWTLIYEMYFYLVFGALLWLRITRDRVLALSAFFGVAVMLGLSFDVAAYYPLRVYTNPLVLEFVAGCWLGYWYYRSGPEKIPLLVSLSCLGAGLGLLFVDYYLEIFPNAYRVLTFGIPAMLIVTGALLAESSGATTRNSLVLLIGAASYSIYLFHPLLLQPFVNMASHVVPARPTMAYVVAPLAVFITVLVAVGIHVTLEAPATRWLRQMLIRARPN